MRFAEYWLRQPLVATSGVSAEQTDMREADLGIRLSPALREFYGLVGRRHDLFSNQDTLLSIVERQMYGDLATEFDRAADLAVITARARTQEAADASRDRYPADWLDE